MVQVKKKEVEESIRDAAAALFSRKGFRGTKLSDIAREAGVGLGNIYSYFPSKTHLLYSVYRPWFLERLDGIERAATRAPNPRERVRAIFLGVWRDTPEENPNLANALMEALASDPPGSGKKDSLLKDSERRITEMLRAALPPERHFVLDGDLVSNLCLMAYDGFTINRRLGDLPDLERGADLIADLLLGTVPKD